MHGDVYWRAVAGIGANDFVTWTSGLRTTDAWGTVTMRDDCPESESLAGDEIGYLQ